MSIEHDVTAVLDAYSVPFKVRDMRFLGACGGFSGALFWRVQSRLGPLYVRRWPKHYPTAGALHFIHAVLTHAQQNGFHLAAVPHAMADGTSFLFHAGHLWEVGPWMPGEAVSAESVTTSQLVSAMTCLVHFHRSVKAFRLPGSSSGSPSETLQPSPAVRSRQQTLRQWMSGRAVELQESLARGSSWPEMQDRVERLLGILPRDAPGIDTQLASFSHSEVPLQPCIRDVWSDHVLFSDDQVTGLIDFGSMGVDNVSCDVARLLGSLAGKSAELWRVGLEAYSQVHSLSEVEHRMVQAFDQSGVLLGALNWAAWVFLEERSFEDPTAVLNRMDALLARMESWPSPPPGRGLVV